MQHLEKIKTKLKDLPNKSGVYLFKNESGHIIYIGKAKVLANRVRSYFVSGHKDKKVIAMLEAICDFDFFITLSEKDALSLEANLVKKHKPRYNILLKDDKHPPYIRIDVKKDFPTLSVTRKVLKDGARYFGPYFGGIRVNDIIDIVSTVYQIRSCSQMPLKAKRACLNYDISRCLAPCVGRVTKEQYQANLANAISFLTGKDETANQVLTNKMLAAAEKEEFERAIKYKEQLAMLNVLKQRIITDLENSSKNLDAISLVSDGKFTSASVVLVRYGKLMGVRNFNFVDELASDDALSQFITRYYTSEANGDIPPQVVLEVDLKDDALSEYLSSLSGKKTEIFFAKIGVKKKLVAMASENALEQLTKSLESSERAYQMHEGANQRLAQLLGIKHLRRIECYDISHISGSNQVASGVVCIDGHMAKSEYRRYKIKTVDGIDDFKALAEVLGRRLASAQRTAHNAQCVTNAQCTMHNAQCRSKSGSDGIDVDNVGAAPCRPRKTTQLQKDIAQSTNQPVGACIARPQGSGAGDFNSAQCSGASNAQCKFKSDNEVDVDNINKNNNSSFLIPHSPLSNDVTDLPDLIIIDGGKGQLSSANQSLVASGFNIPIISLAKREEEIFVLSNTPKKSTKRTTKGVSGGQQVAVCATEVDLISPTSAERHTQSASHDLLSFSSIVLPKESFVLKLLQRIRDEAHRFAVSYHRTLRSKKDSSILEKIAGVGAKKRQILLVAFDYQIEKIKSATIEQLSAVDGIDKKTATSVAEYFTTQKSTAPF